MNTEQWRMIPDYDGLYMVSNLGRVKSLNFHQTGRENLLKPYKSKMGYLSCTLWKNGKPKILKLHRLVAMAFIPNHENKPYINHKDENPLNNCVDNLEWCTAQYNTNYGTGNSRRSETLTNGKTAKKIAQYSLDEKLIKIWPSMSEITRQLGYPFGNISRCCRGNGKTAYGFIWKYA